MTVNNSNICGHVYLFKRDLRMQLTEQKGGSCYEHASDWPINSCQSGNRPVNIDGPGCGGGNGRGKGSLAPSSPTEASSRGDNPASHSDSPFTTSQPHGGGGSGRKGQVPTAVTYM